jgi:hypothetical protein
MAGPPRRDEPTGYFRAVAVNFDGTLAEGGRPDPGVLEALSTSTSTLWWGRTGR